VSTRVRVGDVEVRVEADLTPRQLKRIMQLCAGIALGLAEAQGEPEKPPIGFGIVTELEPQPLAEPAPYDDEE
jgi:hypothetical protein